MQQYVPKLLKKQNDAVATTDFAKMKEEGGVRRSQQKKILDIVKEIARALVEYTKNKKKFPAESKFTLKSHQKVRIEDLLQIFVDDLELVKQFLKFVIEDLGQKFPKEIEQLTQINLYHRLLEYYLYSYQMNERKLNQTSNSFKKEITDFIGVYESHITPEYVLFLFQNYKFSEGVEVCCTKLGLRQELLNYYIQHDEKENVINVCTEYQNS